LKTASLNRINLALVVLVAFVAGGSSALLYVFAHPVSITIHGRTVCTFTLPESFGIPNYT
jgi:hypothetical protein